MKTTYKYSYKSKQSNTPLYVCNTGLQQCSSGYSWGPGVRDHYLIHFVSSGNGTFCVNGQEFNIRGGQAFIAYPNETVSYSADTQSPWEYYWIGFNGAEAGLMLSQTDFSPADPVLDFKDDGTLADLIREIYDCRGSRNCDSVRMTGHVYLLLAYLIEQAKHAQSSAPEIYAVKAAEFAQNNYMHGVTVTDMANHVGISRSWLYKDFCRQFHISPFEYLQGLRIDRSKALLINTKLSVKEIALSVGFEDPLYFSRAFKKETGISPLSYRKQKEE